MRTIFALRSKINRLKTFRPNNKRTNKRTKDIETILGDCAPFLTTQAQTLLASQLRLSVCAKSRRRFSDEEKDIALSIFYHSPKAYRFLKSLLPLPSERTVRQYQSHFPIYPGLNDSVFSELKNKFPNRPISDRVVSLLVDEISLAPEIHYNPSKDQFDGVCDDGITRQPEAAKSAVFAMITWINKRMKQVVGYWFLGGTRNSSRTHDIILSTAEKLFLPD